MLSQPPKRHWWVYQLLEYQTCRECRRLGVGSREFDIKQYLLLCRRLPPFITVETAMLVGSGSGLTQQTRQSQYLLLRLREGSALPALWDSSNTKTCFLYNYLIWSNVPELGGTRVGLSWILRRSSPLHARAVQTLQVALSHFGFCRPSYVSFHLMSTL